MSELDNDKMEKVQEFVDKHEGDTLIGQVSDIKDEIDTLKTEICNVVGLEKEDDGKVGEVIDFFRNDKKLLEYAELKLKGVKNFRVRLLELNLSITCTYFSDFKDFLEDLSKGEYIPEPVENRTTGNETVEDTSTGGSGNTGGSSETLDTSGNVDNIELQGKTFCGFNVGNISSSPFYKNSKTGVTRCSKTARENGKKFGLELPSGDAYVAGQNPGQYCRGTLPKNKANDRPKKTWDAINPSDFTSGSKGNYADIFVESKSNYGHRAAAFKDDAGQRYVLDPYTRVKGRLDTTPKKLEDYAKCKKIVKLHFYESKGYTPDSQEIAENPQVENAVKRALNIARNNSHGYSWGGKGKNGNFDCSGLVTNAFKQAGFNVPVSGTATMRENFRKAGFQWISPYNPNNLKRGDILLKDIGADGERHTEIFTGNGKFVGARSNFDGKSGDSSGKEIAESSENRLTNFRWDGVLRYTGHNENMG